jgi:dihydrodipicolinate synthase/N-acetylneuraminate lyase
MVIVPAVFPAAFRSVWDSMSAGDTAAAMRTFAAEILPFSHVFGIGDEIATTKAMLKAMGIFTSDEVLPPLLPVDDRRRALLALANDCASARAREALS